MKQGRSKLAKLYKRIKEYMLDNYKVINYEVKR